MASVAIDSMTDISRTQVISTPVSVVSLKGRKKFAKYGWTGQRPSGSETPDCFLAI
jgi:hypothetical protein